MDTKKTKSGSKDMLISERVKKKGDKAFPEGDQQPAGKDAEKKKPAKKMARGGMAKVKMARGGMAETKMARGGKVKMARGGAYKSKCDGAARRGKTKGTMK